MLSFSQLTKEVLQEKRCLSLLFLVIFGYTLLFGSLYMQNTVTHVPLAVCNLDEGTEGRRLTQMLTESEDLAVEAQVTAVEQAEDLLEDESVYGIVLVPADFSKQLACGQTARVQLVVNNANTVLGSKVLLGVQEVVGSLESEALAQQRLARGASFMQAHEQAAAIVLSQRVLDNAAGGYVDFFLPLLIFHAVQIAIVFILAPVVCEKKRLWPWPAGALLQRILFWSLLTATLAWLALGLAALLFGMQVYVSLKLALLIFLFAFTMTALAFAVGLWIQRPTFCISATLFYIMPSILFSNAVWPRSSMDKLSLILSYLMPIGYIGDVGRTLLLRGSAPLFMQSVVGLMLFSLLFGSLAWVKIRCSGGLRYAG